jgi:hypothetical protein
MSPVELEIISLSGSSKGLASTTATSAGNDDDASGSHTAGGSSNNNLNSSSTSVAGANESVYEELLNNRVGASRSLHNLNNNMLACAAADAITSVVEAEFVAAATLESVIVSLVVDMRHFIALVICWLLFVVVFRMPRKSPYNWRQTSRRCKQNCDPCRNDGLLARRGQ